MFAAPKRRVAGGRERKKREKILLKKFGDRKNFTYLCHPLLIERKTKGSKREGKSKRMPGDSGRESGEKAATVL